MRPPIELADQVEVALSILVDELADVMIYSLLLALELDEDPIRLIEAKLEKNEQKYPVSLSKGKSTKYTDL